ARATLTRGGSKEHCCTQLASMPVSASPWRAVRTNNPLGIRPRAASSWRRGSLGLVFRLHPRPERMAHQLLDAPHLAVQPAAGARAVIHLDRAADALTIRLEGLEAAADDREYLVPLALQGRAHRVQAVVQPTGRDQLQAARHIRRDALALAQRRHAEVE